jgi:phospholipid/cholesterol/gamma-HCH transport system permease protein
MAEDVEKRERPSFELRPGAVIIRGEWRLSAVEGMEFGPLIKLARGELLIDCTEVKTIDTGSLRLIISALRGAHLKFINYNDKVREIIDLVNRAESTLPVPPLPPRGIVGSFGEISLKGYLSFLVLLSFLGETVVEQFRAVLSPRTIRLKELFVQLEQCCLQAVPVVSLVMFLIGTVIAYLFASQTERYGANIFVVDGVTISLCRELSPVIVAIIVAGRSGSAFTAQLGTMKLNEEVDALETLGLSRMRVLILPRFIALIISLPILVAVGDVVGILGGVLVADYRLQILPDTFFQRTQEVLRVRHVYVGLCKAPIFAAFVAVIGCKMGLTVENNARSVGMSTTSTVVQSIVSVILLNAAFAVLLVELGI